MVGVWLVSDCVFTELDGVGVESAEELEKATCVCGTARARLASRCVCKQAGESPLNELRGGSDTKALCGEKGVKTEVGGAEKLPAASLFFRRAAVWVWR